MIKGIFLHIISRICFVLGSYAMHFFLGRYLTEEAYGIVGTIITIMNFEYIFFTDGVKQAMSRAISSGEYREEGIIKTGAIFQLGVVALFFAATFFGAPVIAKVLGDISLIPYIRNLAFLLPFTGLYSLTLGILNGHNAFGPEAGISSIYPFLKLSVIPAVLFLFPKDSVLGVQAGFLFAAVTISIISLLGVIRIRASVKNDKARQMPAGEYIKTALGYLVLFSASTFMMNLDTLILKRVTGNDALVGYYTGVVNFAKIPYYLLTACYTVALPVITGCYARGELREAANRIGNIITLILSFIMPVVIVVAGASSQVLRVFYKASYGVGADALSLLLFGVGFVGMMLFFCTVLSGADRTKEFMGASVLSLVLQGVLCYILTGLIPLTGTALATFMAAGAGMIATGLFARKTFGNYINKKHVVLLAIQILLFFVYRCIFKYAVGDVGFVKLVLICGIAFGVALIPGILGKYAAPSAPK